MLTLQACDNFVETDPPGSQLSGEIIFEDSRTANAAMAGIYVTIRDNGLLSGSITGLSYNLGLYGDELDYYDSSAPSYYYTNALYSDETGILDTWQQSYKQIYAINAVIEGIDASTVLDQAVKDQLSGEAHFLRAMIHFYLTGLYGNIPYVSTTDYRTNAVITKMMHDQLVAAVITDLEKAVAKLPEDYSEPERIRPNRFAAYALLSRVLLYNGDWQGASDAASAVINQGQYSIVSLPDQVFLKESPETLWQFMPLVQGDNTNEGHTFIFESGPPPRVALSSHLVNAFEPGDLRKDSWIKMVTDGTSQWYHSFKYKENTNTGTSKEYSVILRLAEQYLIRAEARAQQGDIIGARQDLNVIRSRAGLEQTEATDQQELLVAIQQERRVELFTEMGHRFFDLKRTGRLDGILSSVKPGWNTTDELWPLPSVELDANPNLNPQNPGY